MAVTDILDGIGKAFWSGVKWCKNNYPTLEFIGGTALVIGGTAHLVYKAEDIAEVQKKIKNKKEENVTTGEIVKGVVTSMGPGILMITVGEGFEIKAHVDIKEQLASTAAKLFTVSGILANYRGRVRDEEGEEKDYHYLTGEEVVKKDIVNDDGSVETVIETKDGTELVGGQALDHGFHWDESNPNWTGIPSTDLFFISRALTSANDFLHFHTWMTDNDIFDKFDVSRTKEGQRGGAFRDWGDGTVEHKLRINPVGIQGLVNGTSKYATIIFEYDDGTPLSDDVWNAPEMDAETVHALPARAADEA